MQLLHYNLDCYACQLGRPDEAMQRLARAIDLNTAGCDIRLEALDDPDLEPLWTQIGDI
jgi:hypothetical protein